MNHTDKLDELKKRIAEKGKLLVAYSGGVDSSLLASVAHDVLRDKSLAVVLDSETVPRSELQHATALAKYMGLNYWVAKFSILKNDKFSQNPATRCHICKKKVGSGLERTSQQRDEHNGIADRVNGSDYRTIGLELRLG